MNTPPRTPSTTEVATEVNGLLAGLGILTVTLFPFALSALLLVVAPLAVLALAGALLAIPVVVPLWLVRSLRRGRARRRADGSVAGPAPRRVVGDPPLCAHTSSPR
jgi:membrane protein implicated in regulation of membrane protease activity